MIRLISFLTFSLMIFSLSVLASDAVEEDGSDQKGKVEKLCENDPLNQKCKKFLDGKYRRHNDAEKPVKADKEDLLYSKDDKSHESELRNELITFCRNEPDAPRCSKVRR